MRRKLATKQKNMEYAKQQSTKQAALMAERTANYRAGKGFMLESKDTEGKPDFAAGRALRRLHGRARAEGRPERRNGDGVRAAETDQPRTGRD